MGFDPWGGPVAEQKKLVEMQLKLCRPNLPLVLQWAMEEKGNGMQLMTWRGDFSWSKEFEPHQVIQLHCFSGSRAIVREWQHQFPNCYFSYSGLIRTFSPEQNQALKSVPEGRLLVETDSPYLRLQSGAGPNLPIYIWQTVEHIAEMRGTTVGRIADATWKNSRIFFQPKTDMVRERIHKYPALSSTG